MNTDSILQLFAKAARKQRKGLEGGYFGHAPICNYQHSSCKKCNCGVADLLSALNQYERQSPQLEVDEEQQMPVDLSNLIASLNWRWPSHKWSAKQEPYDATRFDIIGGTTGVTWSQSLWNALIDQNVDAVDEIYRAATWVK